MKISPAAELAVRGVLVLARQFGKGPVALSTVCADGELPRQYLMKIFASLAKAGIVTPLRGKHGGYVLARQPSQITLLEVIEAVEGPICLNYCQHSPPKCDRVTCKVRPVWTELQRIVRNKLASVRLSDCITEEDQAPASPAPNDKR